MSDEVRVQTKAVKVTIPIDASQFSFERVPAPGTPGSKGMAVTYAIEHGGGVVRATLKVPGLQRLQAAVQAAEHGGFVVVQGKLGEGGVILEAGAIFQPKPAPAPTAEVVGPQP